MPSGEMPTVAEIVQAQIDRVSASGEKYKRGVSRVKEAPGAAAARKADKYVMGVTMNVDKWKANVASVSASDWINFCIKKGAARLISGITEARPKLEGFWNDFRPKLETVTSATRSMPNDSYEQRKARANAQMDGVHQYSRRRS